MIGNINLFNELENSRYMIVVDYNGQRYQLCNTSQGPQWELELNINYHQLIEELKNQLHCESASAIQQFRNHLSTLNGFLLSIGKTEDSKVGTELQSGFDNAIDRYIKALDISKRTKSDKRSHLNKWKSAYKTLSRLQSAEDVSRELNQFHSALHQAVISSGMTRSQLTKQTEISQPVLYSWLRGAMPNARSLPSVHRLERVLGLERDSLWRLVAEAKEVHLNEGISLYRQRLSKLIHQPYKLTENEVSSQLDREWWDYFKYKSSEYTAMTRSSVGLWRLRPVDQTAIISARAHFRGQAAASADFAWSIVSNFLGFLRLPVSEGGYGVLTEDAQTLAWLAHPLAVQSYLEYITLRSEGLRHGTHRRVTTFIISLCRAEKGYLWQQPHFFERIPQQHRPHGKDWQSMCAEATKVSEVWKRKSTDKSRNPFEAIAELLALPYPLNPVFTAIARLDAEAAALPSDGIMCARRKRDALLLSLLIYNPLRILNYKLATWRPNNTGHIYKTSEGKWRIRFDGREMKTKKPYDVKIASAIAQRLEEYLEEHRITLLKGSKSDYLFPAFHSNGMCKKLDRVVFKLTKKYVAGCQGFGPHAFRHLVATDWLRKHPNDFMTVSELLNDRLETVIASYAHLKKDDSFDKYENYIQNSILK